MRIAQINAVSYGSTGRIMFELADRMEAAGHSVLCTAGFTWKRANRSDFVLTGSFWEKSFHMALAFLTGRIGCFSSFATLRLLRKLDRFKPDIIHLHILHGWFVNLPMLFDYIRERQIPVVWTLHDCWGFTGHCPHFDSVDCTRWKTSCHNCPRFRCYPRSLFDYSRQMYQMKKRWFSGVNNLTIVTPSSWMAEMVSESFLKDYFIRVLPNGINTDVFSPTKSDFRDKYGLKGKYLVLGVAYAWDNKKGLDVFIKISQVLGDNYVVVLVGTDERTDKLLPTGIISIHRTQDKAALAEIYTAADVFVNPTREDTFPTVNLEALACGVPIVTFAVGGSPEILDDRCGCAVPKDDITMLLAQIRRVCEEKPYTTQDCLHRAKQFSVERCMSAYEALYEEVNAHD